MTEKRSLVDAAAAGDPVAQVKLARAHFVGRSAPLDVARGMELVRSACAQRYPLALLFHATLAILGLGRPQSWADAMRLLLEAADLGDADAQGQIVALGGSLSPDSWFAPAITQQHCAAPRIYTIASFLPQPACQWLIERARRRLQPAPVKDASRGSVVDGIRSNTAAGFDPLFPDLIVQLTSLRIAAATGIPFSHQESTNILHYDVGQEYRRHYDFVRATEEHGFQTELATMGQRVVTLLVFLNEEFEGGETEFPLLDWRFKGQTGDALAFWNLSASGEREAKSLHSGLPVTSGQKWILSQWIRQKPVPLV